MHPRPARSGVPFLLEPHELERDGRVAARGLVHDARTLGVDGWINRCTMWTWNVGPSRTASASPLASTVRVPAGFGPARMPLMDTRCSHPHKGTSRSSPSSGNRRTDRSLTGMFSPASTPGRGRVCASTRRTTLLGPVGRDSLPSAAGDTTSPMRRTCGGMPVDGTASRAWFAEGRVTRGLLQGD